MAKRSADQELTHDNWDQEQEEEEAGLFRCATKDVLKTREIKKAKRSGVTADKGGGAGAFKGFSFGITTTTTSSKPVSFTMQPSNTIAGNSAPTSAFGGCTTASVAVEMSDGSKRASPNPSSGDVDAESQYRRRLRTLNESVLRWIDDHIKTNPYCILTPVFSDYEKYIKELDTEFPQSSDKVVDKTPVATPAAAAGLLLSSFGASSTFSSVASNSQAAISASANVATGNSEGRSLAPPTSNAAVTTGFSAPGLSFGAPDTNAVTGFGRGTAPSIGATSSGLNHGAQPAKDTTSPAHGVGFGVQPSKDAIAKASFGAQPSKEPAASPASTEANPFIAGFSFGSPKDTVAKTSGFSFGAQPSKEPAVAPASTEANSFITGFNFGPTKDAVAKTSGFSFGAQSSKEPATSPASTVANPLFAGFNFGPTKDAVANTSGFSFGAQPSAASSALSISGFSFGHQPSKEAAAVASTSAPNPNGGEDDIYVPPEPEVVNIKEDDAFYTIRCKLFCKIDNVFKDRGVGNLYLKPCGEKTQLLMRADTNLGNILLNILLNKNIPTSCQSNNVTFFCVPNPPLDEKKRDDKTPVCMLLKVKTAEDAEALLKQLNDYKNA